MVRSILQFVRPFAVLLVSLPCLVSCQYWPSIVVAAMPAVRRAEGLRFGYRSNALREVVFCERPKGALSYMLYLSSCGEKVNKSHCPSEWVNSLSPIHTLSLSLFLLGSLGQLSLQQFNLSLCPKHRHAARPPTNYISTYRHDPRDLQLPRLVSYTAWLTIPVRRLRRRT